MNTPAENAPETVTHKWTLDVPRQWIKSEDGRLLFDIMGCVTADERSLALTAPELFKACEKALKFQESLTNPGNPECVVALRAVLAKAQGGPR